jgi:hypothetical protein
MDDNTNKKSYKDLAISTLTAICEDASAPASARALASRTLLEMLGEIGKLQTERPKENKSLHEMTRAELDAELRRLDSLAKRAPKQARIRQPLKAKAKSKDRSKA